VVVGGQRAALTAKTKEGRGLGFKNLEMNL
jgi:hypothetical protein